MTDNDLRLLTEFRNPLHRPSDTLCASFQILDTVR